ncbi:hypothetical protein D6089_22685 [Vibrio vulnificus]|nr:hypothetical protein [Vibrio vulnificus]
MSKKGGTKMYCPSCKEIEVCTAIPLTSLGKTSGQRWYREDHEDINWFRRGRECQGCGHDFVTAEIDEEFVDELVELRDALKEIKANAEKYSKEAAKAGATLNKLSKSLKVLKALKMYKKV